MDSTEILNEARAAVETVTGRTADLLCSLPSADTPIPGSAWTIRDTAAHLVNGAAMYVEIANGAASPLQPPTGGQSGARRYHDGLLFRESAAVVLERLVADVAETDPTRLAKLVLEGIGQLVDTTAGRPGDQPVSFHWGLPMTLADLMCHSLAEQIVHGYDMATAAGFPSPIDPAHVALVLSGYAPAFPLVIHRARSEGLNLAYEVDVRGVGSAIVRFVDGEYRGEPAETGQVDCVISVDPAAYLLIITGRMDRWPAIATGLMSVGGPHPELAWRFLDLIVFP